MLRVLILSSPYDINFFRSSVRSQCEAYDNTRAKTALDCVLFCLRGNLACTSLNYAEPTSVNDGKENCQLHNETKNGDEISLKFVKDDRYIFYRILSVSHESENTMQTTENVTEQVVILRNQSCLSLYSSRIWFLRFVCMVHERR